MINATTHPTLPGLEGLAWRPLAREDLPALVELTGACHQVDGGLGFMFEPDSLVERYFPDSPGTATGAFTADERLAACASVHLEGRLRAQRAVIVGQVRPDLRNRGIGAYLMGWSLAQAQAFPPGAAPGRRVLQVATEALTEPAHRLYAAHGFEQVFESIVMRRKLDLALPDQPLPPDVTIATWQPDLAEQFYQAYQAAFRERPGYPGWSAAEWIARVTDNDLVTEWSLVASAGDTPVGFIIGTIDLTSDPPGGLIWQVGVIPARRRGGLCSALMVESMRRMKAAGPAWALLTVHTDNPGAIQTYTRLGFASLGSRALYERMAEA